jgi:hypothetical protein
MAETQRLAGYIALGVVVCLYLLERDARIRADIESKERVAEVKTIEKQHVRTLERERKLRLEFQHYVDSVENIVENQRRKIQVLDRSYQELKPEIVARTESECPQLLQPLNRLLTQCELRIKESDALIETHVATIQQQHRRITDLESGIAVRDSNTVRLIDNFQEEHKAKGTPLFKKLSWAGIGALVFIGLSQVF